MIKIGDVEVQRIEEVIIYEPMSLFADFRPEAAGRNSRLAGAALLRRKARHVPDQRALAGCCKTPTAPS